MTLTYRECNFCWCTLAPPSQEGGQGSPILIKWCKPTTQRKRKGEDLLLPFNWHFKNPFTWSSLIPITQTSKDCVFTIHKYAILVLHKLVTRKHHEQWCLTSFLCLRSSLSIKECSLITWPMLSLPTSAPLSCTRQLNLLWSSFLSATSFSTWSFRS